MWNEGGEPVVPGGMDCLQLRHPTAGPFHYLISEQAKSLVALQELQHEVGALLEFRDLVMETFPNLRTKLAQSTPNTMTSHHHHHHHTSNIPVSIRTGDWTPGVRVRKKIGSAKDESRNIKKNGDIAVQDSGFSTETSSKETHSASSTAPPPSSTAPGGTESDEVEDELWNLLDVIHRKGTRLKREADALQGTLRDQGTFPEDGGRELFCDDVRQLRQERDDLLDKLAEMEAEVLAGRVHTTRLQEDLENLLSTKHDLEEQLKAVVMQRGEVNSRIHDLHLQFVTKSNSVVSPSSPPDGKRLKYPLSDNRKDPTSSQRTANRKSAVGSELDNVLSDKALPKVKVPDTRKISAILREHDPLVLQKHLLTTTVQNQVLKQKVDSAVNLEMGLRDELNKYKEENEDLRFQLEDKNIELEGTRARIRLLEDFQKPNQKHISPDIIPSSESPSNQRTEITTSSMKNMSPLPMNLQMDHSSSTESAHDQSERDRRDGGNVKQRRPSKIPLKSYTAPKPPGGKHSPAPGTRSRSGDSPGRPHSAQSWRNRSEGNSLKNNTSNSNNNTNGSLPKSRNSSLISARDSLSSKLRSSDSLLKLATAATSPNSFKESATAPKKATAPRNPSNASNSSGQKDEKTTNSNSAKGKSQYPWTLSSYNSKPDLACYPDSLNQEESLTETSSSHRFQTANTFLWNVGVPREEFYDSIDSNVLSNGSFYRPGGEELAECDSLERHLSDWSDRK